MRYVIKEATDSPCQIVEKTTICEPDLFSCQPLLISAMTALMSDNVQPRYYHMENDLVKERVIYLRDVCVYRDFVWNVSNPASFMRKSNYYLVYGNVDNLCSVPEKVVLIHAYEISLRHELMTVHCNFSQGLFLPCQSERPSGPRIRTSAWEPTNAEQSSGPFWPKIKESIISHLKHKSFFDFFPTTNLKVAPFLVSTIVRDTRKEHLKTLLLQSKKKCMECEQDYCVWSMNRIKIIRNVLHMKGGIWKSFHSNHDRIAMGCRIAIYIINNGYGRHWDRNNAPMCVVIGLTNSIDIICSDD